MVFSRGACPLNLKMAGDLKGESLLSKFSLKKVNFVPVLYVEDNRLRFRNELSLLCNYFVCICSDRSILRVFKL
jgi:hypothetical protein